MEKTECKERFFDNSVRLKDLYWFKAVTPKQNHIEGYICNARNEYLGSMVILKLNDKNVVQFVHAMPKIHYYNDGMKLIPGNTQYHAYEKLDGTCLIIYPLLNEKKEVIEIVPKTRGTPVADDWVIEMYKYVDDLSIQNLLNRHPDMILIFELYGVLNHHEIFYTNCYIDLVCIGIIHDDLILDGDLVDMYASKYHLKRPRILYTLSCDLDNNWHIYKRDLLELSLYDDTDYSQVFDSQAAAFDSLKQHITVLNNNYRHRHNRSIVEGVVINTINIEGNHLYIKCKSSEIEELHQSQNGIRSVVLKKEIYKYFDEYGAKVRDIYKDDPSHYYNYVVEGLSEEFPDVAINNPITKNRIESIFLRILESRTPSQGLQQLCTKLVEDNPNKNLPELMQIFAKDYPEYKNKSRMVFSILKSIKGD